MDERCSIPACDRTLFLVSLRLCEPHYRRLRRHGDPEGGGVSRMVDPFIRFAEQVAWDGECLIWTGASLQNGTCPYGRMKVNGRAVLVHRWVYEREHGRLDPGVVVRHTCDVSLCAHLDHLIPGTIADNVRDTIERGRAWWLTRVDP